MSIINETLNRLETDSPVPAGRFDKTFPPRPAVRRTGFPLKVMATAMLAVFAGTSLAVWYWNGQLGDATEPSLAQAGSQAVPGGTSEHQLLSPLPVGAQTSPKPQPAVQNSETATAADQAVAPSPPMPGQVLSDTGKQPIQAHGSSPQPRSGETRLAATDVEPARVKAPSAKAKPAPSASHKQQQAEAQQPAAPPAPLSTEAVSEAGKQPQQAKGSSRQTRSGEKPLAVAKVEATMAKAPDAKSESAPTAPAKQQRAAKAEPSGDTVQPSAVDEAVERARVALARGQYPQALSALETLSPVPERRGDYWLIKGSVHLGLGQLDQAEQALAAAQPLAPDNAQIAVQRAIIQQERGDHASALQILEDAATHHPDVPEIFLNQGYSQQALGAVQDARRSFRIFLKISAGRSLYGEQRKAVTQWLAQFSPSSN
jgi:tetratricopeptide (TPR) repeat protein